MRLLLNLLLFTFLVSCKNPKIKTKTQIKSLKIMFQYQAPPLKIIFHITKKNLNRF